MCKVWQQAGNEAALEVAQGADHFSLLQPFTEPDSALFRRIDALLETALR